MTRARPRVSIGLPVYNGENYIRESLESILNQSFSDFELIISDNASTDHTEQICLEYASSDNRIRYYRNEKNMGLPYNHNRVFLLSYGEYFKWAGHDDIINKDFLLKCVEFLDKNPSVILCSTKTGRINNKGELEGIYEFNVRYNALKPHERFYDFIVMRNHAWLLLLGLIRSSYLKKTRLLGDYHGSDTNLLSELALLGSMFEIPELLFFRRQHSKAYTDTKWQNYKERASIYTASKPPRFIFPYWRICQEYIRSIRYVPLSITEQFLCFWQILKYVFEVGGVYMTRDIFLAIFEDSRLHRIMYPLGKHLTHQVNKE